MSIHNPLRRLRLPGIVALASLLAGCGAAPGFRYHADPAMPPVKFITDDLLDAQERADAIRKPDPRVSALIGQDDGSYRVGPRDVLSIVVWNHPELSAVPAQVATGGPLPVAATTAGFQVDEGGMLNFPLVGQLAVRGLDSEGIRLQLTAALSVYIREPKVAVRVMEFRDRRIFVDGEVRLAGAKPITDVPMSLAQALADAGGLTPNGDISRVRLTRDGKVVDIDFSQQAGGGVAADRILLRDKDMVRVLSRETNLVYVAGEVGQPNALPMRDGQMNLSEALARSGSINPLSSNPHGIYVIRPRENGRAGEVFQLDAKSPAALALAARFALRPRDLVYVDSSALMRWNRIASLLVPSSQAIYNTQRASEVR